MGEEEGNLKTLTITGTYKGDTVAIKIPKEAMKKHIDWRREVEGLLLFSLPSLQHPNVVKAIASDRQSLILGILFPG